MAELDPPMPIEELDDRRPSPTIRINPPVGDRQVQAFARLAAVVDRATLTEVPPAQSAPSEAGIHVHSRPPEPTGSSARVRQEAVEALATADADHRAALEHSRICWQEVHDREEQVERISDDEAAALRAFELLRENRRNAERALRQARSDGDDASHRCLITSRVLENARIRADRL